MAEAQLVVGGSVIASSGVETDLAKLRTFTGQLAQVTNLILLIGSGASMHLGSPTVRAVGRETLGNLARHSGAPLSQEGETALELLVGEGPVDLETLLGTLSAAISYAANTQSSEVVAGDKTIGVAALKTLRLEINRTLAAACDLPALDCELVDPLAGHKDFFGRILAARREGAAALRVFTTNYDLVIEKALDDLGVPFIDGFVGTYRRRFLPAMYDLQHSGRPTIDGRRQTVSPLVYLYKMHGSVNWRASTVHGRYAVLSEAVTSPTQAEGLALIYPTPQKEGDVLGFPYSDLMRGFSDALRLPETALVSVGYGFRDEHINRIVTQGLESNPTLQLLVVEPYGKVLSFLDADDSQPVPSQAAALARSSEARISVLTGEGAEFEQLAACWPDPGLRRVGLDPGGESALTWPDASALFEDAPGSSG